VQNCKNGGQNPMTQNIYDMQEPKRRGMKPGQPNPGAFKKGDDSRRAHGMVLMDGKTFAAKARELGPAVLEFWNDLYRDEEAPLPMRLRASELIVERGYGKAQQNVNISVDERPITTLTEQELMALIGEQPVLPALRAEGNVIDADFTTVTTTEEQT
jgi:hypothetical protein